MGTYVVDNIIVTFTEAGHAFEKCTVEVTINLDTIAMSLIFDSTEAESIWGTNEYLYEYGQLIIQPK